MKGNIGLSLILVSVLFSGCAAISSEPKKTEIKTVGLERVLIFPKDNNESVKPKFFQNNKEKSFLFSSGSSYSGYNLNETYFNESGDYVYWTGVYLLSSGGNRYSDSYLKYQFIVDCAVQEKLETCKIKTKNGIKVEDSWVTADKVQNRNEYNVIETISNNGYGQEYELLSKYESEVILKELQNENISARQSRANEIDFTFKDEELGVGFVKLHHKKAKEGYRVSVSVKLYPNKNKENTYNFDALNTKIKSVLSKIVD